MTLRRISLRPALFMVMIVASLFRADASSGNTVTEQDRILRAHLDSLASATTAPESIAILFDVFDILPPTARPQLGETLYRLVRSESGDDSALDALRLLAIIYSSDSDALNKILQEAYTLPESDERSETIVFIRIYLAKKQAQSESMAVRKEKLADMVTPEGPILSGDFYEDLLRLFTICVYIREVTQGNLLNEHLHYLDRVLSRHPLTTFAIRRQYFDMKAEVFSANDDPEGAVEADKELLKIVDDMEREYKEQERRHLALHWFRYRAYTRILHNMRAITVADAEKYYRAVNALADSIPEVRAAYNEHHYPDIYYLLKKKRYAEVMPMLRRELATEEEMKQRRYLLRQVIETATATNDRSTLLSAITEYIPLLESYVNRKAAESSNEMEIIYKIGRMRKDAIEEEIEARRETGRHHNVLIICVSVAIAVVIAAIIVLLVLSARLIRTGRKLKRSNTKLLARRDELKKGSDELIRAIEAATKAEHQKDAFIKYISSTISLPLNSIMEYSSKVIESSDKGKRRFLERFATVVQENSEQLKSIASKLRDWAGERNHGHQPDNSNPK